MRGLWQYEKHLSLGGNELLIAPEIIKRHDAIFGRAQNEVGVPDIDLAAKFVELGPQLFARGAQRFGAIVLEVAEFFFDVVPSRSQFGNHLRASARCVLVAWAIRNLADGARTEQSLTQRGLVIRPKTPRRLPQSCVGVFAQDRDGEMPTNRLSDSTRPLFATNARHAGVSCAFCFKGTVLIRSSAFWPQFAARRLYEVY